jgi:hypothetical protein
MIIQKVIKGITGDLSQDEARKILVTGIKSNWLRLVPQPAEEEIQERLTEENLRWHQNYYKNSYPGPGGEPFGKTTPFISTTAGTVEVKIVERNGKVSSPTNEPFLPWKIALDFATKFKSRDDGYLYFCYIFILGKKSIRHRGFSEELRDLNLYTEGSPFHYQGEITAKLIIPSVQIERLEHWSYSKALQDLSDGKDPGPIDDPIPNDLYERPEEICNLRELLHYTGHPIEKAI